MIVGSHAKCRFTPSVLPWAGLSAPLERPSFPREPPAVLPAVSVARFIRNLPAVAPPQAVVREIVLLQ